METMRRQQGRITQQGSTRKKFDLSTAEPRSSSRLQCIWIWKGAVKLVAPLRFCRLHVQNFSFLHFKSRIWCGKVEGIGISRVCGSAAQNLREDQRQGPHGIEDLSALPQMGKWSREWSPCDPAQCWVELWLIWCSGGIKNQLASKFDCKSSYLESEVEFAEWASWKDAGTPTSTIN